MTILLLGLGLLAVVALAAWWLRGEVERLSHHVVDRATDTVVQRASQEFAHARQQDVHELALSKQTIEHTVGELGAKLEKVTALVRELESNRHEQFGTLKNELARVLEQTDRLGQTTSGLVSVLGNARVRGQWGEKMAEDILAACGLQQGIQYVKEKEIAAGRPDYTFLLPEQHKLFMDVKFPLDHYLAYVQSHGADQQRAKDQFMRAVRDHLRTMERRDYVAHEDGSLDYIIIFIPNEQVYGVVNEWMPGLIDECLKKRTIVCGPWTLYAILRVIWQAWRNYNYSLAIRDIITTINGFLQDYAKFKERFGEVGERLHKALEKYEEVATTSYRRLDARLQQIEGYRKGHQIPEEAAEPDPPAALTLKREDS